MSITAFTNFISMKLNSYWNHSLLPYFICEKFLLADKRKCYCNFLPNLNFIKKVSCRNAATQIQDHDRSRNWFRQRKSNDDDIMISLHRLLLYVFMMIVKIFSSKNVFHTIWNQTLSGRISFYLGYQNNLLKDVVKI